MRYGYGNTIHQTGNVNVEIGPDGHVVAVWFRCMPLPFDEHVVDQSRADDMKRMMEGMKDARLIAVDVVDE